MADRLSILHRLDKEADGVVIQRAKEWLARNDTRLVSDVPARVTVKRAAHLWRVRLQNSLSSGYPLQGAEPLLSNLKQLTQNAKVEQFGFIGSEISGNILFEQANGRLVGVIMVDRSAESHSSADAGLAVASAGLT